jgi:hypothetical protein
MNKPGLNSQSEIVVPDEMGSSPGLKRWSPAN